LFIGAPIQGNLFSSRRSESSDVSAGLVSLAGSHNFSSPSTNLGSVFGSTSGSGSGSGSNYNFKSSEKLRSSMTSGVVSDVKYLTKEDLTPLVSP
jgi:hypothetical protein